MNSTTMTVDWLALRSAAVTATRRGWPVAPGTLRGADRHWHGREEATALCLDALLHSGLSAGPDDDEDD